MASSAIHEVLLALLGHTGDVFIDTRRVGGGAGGLAEPDGGTEAHFVFRLAPDLEFFSEPERRLLNELVQLGYYYSELDDFVARERGYFSDAGGGGGRSLYRRALAVGLTEVLEVYREAVLALEQETMQQAAPVLGTLQVALSEYHVLLPALHSLVAAVLQEQARGGAIQAALHARVQSGIPALQACLQRLLWHCNQLMYKQLSAWVIHGLLLDEHEEFFIQPLPDDPGGAGAGAAAAGAGAHPAASTYEPLASPDGAGPGGPPVGEEDPITLEWHRGYCVKLELLPPYISLPAAESILFAGKAVRVLRQPRGKLHGRELLPPEDALATAEALKALQAAPSFHALSFERTVDSVRQTVAGHLWSLLVEHAELPRHLDALKGYFLLAKGDFYQFFLVEGRALMKLPPRAATAEADLNVPFQQSALKTSAAEDERFANVRLRMPAPGAATPPQAASTPRVHVPSFDGWDALSLSYRVDWPLGLLLTPQALAQYNSLFQYLLRLKRMQIELEEAWATMRRMWSKGGAASEGQAKRLPLWRLRQQMAYLFTNLQIYIQVDVIETQHAKLQERVAAARDFLEMERAHQQYLAALVTQSFLDIGTISNMLDNLIKLGLQLCAIVEADDGTDAAAAANSAQLEDLEKIFSKRSNMLYIFLRGNKLAGRQRAPFLRQFLLRLDFNNFYFNTAKDALFMPGAGAGAGAGAVAAGVGRGAVGAAPA